MQSLSDDERKEVLGEVLADELKLITEYVKDVPLAMRKIDSLGQDMKEVKSDIKVIRAAVTDNQSTAQRRSKSTYSIRSCLIQRVGL